MSEVPVIVEEKKEMTALDRITILGDLANACKDSEIVDVLRKKANGTRLYDLFIQAVSDEIDRTMNPGKKDTPAVMNIHGAAQEAFMAIQRIGHVINAIEQGPALAVLNTLMQKIDSNFAAANGEQPQASPVRQQQSNLPSGDRGGGRRGGPLSSF